MTNNTKYWNEFYNTKGEFINNASNFCLFVMEYFNEHSTLQILDAGCGNGRDSYTLASRHNVVGADNSGYKPDNATKCTFQIADFVTMDKSDFDLIYSRFTFHSISNESHKIFLDSIQSDTYLCIETRSDKGIDSTRHYGDDHYRNFTNFDYLTNILDKCDFEIMYITESDNVAVYKDENPICIRVLCRKR